jgi:phosphoribosylglycinamide formyltransferase 1
MTHRTLRIAALISGGGRTLMNIADHIDRGRLPAEIVLVIASRAGAPGVELARARGFDVRVAPRDQVDHIDDLIDRWLGEKDVDLVCLCGYLRLLPMHSRLVGRVMNIHPGPLPDFGGKGMFGKRVHRAVLAAGLAETACTVHFVDAEYDHGPVILQRKVPVLPDDDVETLAARVFEQECIAYPEAIRLFAEGRLRLAGDVVEIE